MAKRTFKYTSKFTSVARCVFDADKNKYLASASIDELRNLLPTQLDDDLLPIAANACVVNLVNKNNDAISTKTALNIKGKFQNKHINVEHDRSHVVGHLVNAQFSKFNTNYAVGGGSELLADDEISGNAPFNISIGGYIYDVVAPNVVQQIIDTNDPNSPSYLTLSLSWELGFDEYKLLLGSQLVEEGEIIEDPTLIEAYSQHLKAYGGSGKLEDGRSVYRLLDGMDVVPLGVALTFAPAGQVAGVLTDTSDILQPEEEGKSSIEKNIDIPENLISQNEINTVTDNIQETYMPKKLTSLAEIKTLNDENVKDYSLANIAEILESEGTRLIQEYQAKVDAEKAASSEVKAQSEKALADLAGTKDTILLLQKQIDEIRSEQAAAEALSKFNDRMAGLDEEYELDDETRAALAGDIRTLDDANFEKFLASFKAYNKKNKKQKMDPNATPTDADKEKAAKAALASLDAAAIAEQALNNVVPVKNQEIPNVLQPNVALTEKYKAAFSGDNFKITTK